MGEEVVYQIYDSMQAFSSSIASLLASRAVLEGVGVGDADATATGALLLSILQSSMGRIATILFAHRLGTSLEPECKMYRLSADIFNDSGMILDCLSPAFPKPTRVMMYSCSSVLRSLCGVAAGSSKASLSAHFAKWGNLGELNAKDSSQETIISLLGMLAGSLVVSHIKTQFATWSAMIFLLAIHLGTNYLAVRAVSMRTLNRQRANIVFSHYLTATSPNRSQKQKQKAETPPEPRILNPNQVSLVERIFERDGVLRWNNSSVYGRCILGIDLQSILKEMSRQDPSSNSFTKAPVDPKRLIKSIHARGYFLWYAPDRNRYQITFSTTATVKTQLLAWFHALVAAHELHNEKAGVVDHEVDARMTDGATRGRFLIRHFLFVQSAAWTRRKTVDPVGELRVEDIWEFLDVMGQVAIERFEGLWRGLKENGWDLETGALETKSGTRVKVIGDGLEEKEKL